MNKKNIFVIFMIMAIFAVSCSSSGSSGASISLIGEEGGEWVLKIDDLTVYEDRFNKEFDYALKMSNRPAEEIALLKNNERAKQEFLDGLISQILILNEADSTGFFETEESKDFLETAYRSLKVQYYTQKLMEDAMLETPEPTQEQISMFYEQYKTQLAQEGVTELNAQTIPYLSQVIKSQQAQQRMIMSVNDMKDKARIDRNKDVIGELVPVMPGTQQGAVAPQSALPGQEGDDVLR